MQVSLSLWSMDQARVAGEVQRYDELVDSYHVDVMDGRFADDLLFGPLAVQTLRALTGRPIVVHLMVAEPARWVSRFVDAGADLLAVHPSACGDFSATLGRIRDAGAAAGAAVGLTEHSQPVLDHFGLLSTVLVMGTAIGVKGRPFDEAALDTVQRMVAARTPDARTPVTGTPAAVPQVAAPPAGPQVAAPPAGPQVAAPPAAGPQVAAPPAAGPQVFVDGGIRWTSIPKIAAAGADGVVAGSVVTSAADPRAATTAIAAS